MKLNKDFCVQKIFLHCKNLKKGSNGSNVSAVLLAVSGLEVVATFVATFKDSSLIFIAILLVVAGFEGFSFFVATSVATSVATHPLPVAASSTSVKSCR
ncbi:MAG: hypothetical protein V7K41_15485 [Nostoc sp.]